MFAISCPPRLSFLAEILLGVSICSIFPLGFCFIFMLMFFASGACLFILYTSTMHGRGVSSLSFKGGGSLIVNYLGLFHVYPLIILFLYPAIC